MSSNASCVGKPPLVFIGLDDVGKSGETGKVCVEAARELSKRGYGKISVYSVDLVNPRLLEKGCKNIAWAIAVEADPGIVLSVVGELAVKKSGPESNPGAAVLLDSPPAAELVALAERIAKERVFREEVYRAAEAYNVELWELGGDGAGVVGAFAAAVLASARRAREVPLPFNSGRVAHTSGADEVNSFT